MTQFMGIKKEKLSIFVAVWIANMESYLTVSGLWSLFKKKEKIKFPLTASEMFLYF